MPEPFIHHLRVRFAECDPQGVVFNSHYLAYVDVGITELWRAAFGSYQTMLDRGLDVVVAEAKLRFRSPARFDDELRLEVAVTHLGNTSIISQHRICREQELLVEIEIRHVTVDRATLGKQPIPDWLRDGLAPWAVAADRTPENAIPADPTSPTPAG
jgi:acyl-CoA thioester hydrolase